MGAGHAPLVGLVWDLGMGMSSLLASCIFFEMLLSINTHSPGEVSVDPGPLAQAGRWENHCCLWGWGEEQPHSALEVARSTPEIKDL